MMGKIEQSLLIRLSSHLMPVAIVLIAMGSILHFQFTRLAILNAQKTQEQAKEIYLQEEKQIQRNLKALSLLPKTGFENLVANWTFLSYLQYFGDDPARNKTGYSIAPDFFKIIVNRDPRFLEIYPYLSSTVTLFAGQPEESVRMIEQGIKTMPIRLKPSAYFLWQAKGTDELLFLGRTKDAQKSYEMAADWAGRSSDSQLQAIAKRTQRTAQYLATNPDSRQARFSAWVNILTSAIDERTRQLAIFQINALGGKVAIDSQGKLHITPPAKD